MLTSMPFQTYKHIYLPSAGVRAISLQLEATARETAPPLRHASRRKQPPRD